MSERLLKIGAFAERTGVSVRTLHYYEAIGLLTPDYRNEARRRFYGANSALRLQQIRSLQALGLSLKEIRAVFEEPDYSPAAVIEKQLTLLRQELAQKQRLQERLAWLAKALRASPQPTQRSLLELIEVIAMFEKHYTPEQLDQLKVRRETLGVEAIRQAEADWRVLIDQVRKKMDGGRQPDDPDIQPLAAKWQALINAFTGGDAGIAQSLAEMHRREGPKQAQSHGYALDPEMMAFMRKAIDRL